MVREFGVSKFTALFLMTFMTMGVVVIWVLYSMHWILKNVVDFAMIEILKNY